MPEVGALIIKQPKPYRIAKHTIQVGGSEVRLISIDDVPNDERKRRKAQPAATERTTFVPSMGDVQDGKFPGLERLRRQFTS